MKIAIIGAGNLGSSIADGLYINNMITELYLTKNNLSTLTKWKKIPNVSVSSNNVEAVNNSDIIIYSFNIVRWNRNIWDFFPFCKCG